MRTIACATIGALVMAGAAHAATLAETLAETQVITSPDGRTAIAVDRTDHGLSYRVERDHKLIVSGPLGLVLDKGKLGDGATAILGHTETAVDTTFDLPVGKVRTVRDHYAQSKLDFQTAAGVKFDLVVRAYDAGVAFRWLLPAQAGLSEIIVKSEATRFDFPADYDCWGFNVGHYNSSFEGEFDKTKASMIRNANLYVDPLVCKTGQGETTFALAEADKRDYAGAFFNGRGDGGLGVEVNLSPRTDNDIDVHYNQIAVKAAMPAAGFDTPWRVVMIGDTPGALTESTLVQALAEPSRIADTSWIKAGKTAWDWWNGYTVDVPHPGANTESYKAYIDFAASMKLQDILIDEGWYKGTGIDPNPAADVTQPLPAVDLPAIIAYGKSKDVGVWVWLQSTHVTPKMDEAFALYEKWGIKGVKVDFMNRNDQDMVAWYHRILATAAAHHLMVDLHGAYPPDGLLRTWPNFVTQEGVLGAENNKWSARITATHNVTLPFTRMILGPMDYTPGGFHSLPAAEFAAHIDFMHPSVMTTRGQAIAMYVVYDSPLQMVSDAPSAYKGADGADFVSRVPATWDETHVVAGDIGQYIVTARRSGSTWYVGAMTNEQGRTLSVPLGFLPAGSYCGHVWQDGVDINHLATSDVSVKAGHILSLTLAPSGGAAAVFEPCVVKR